jgi:photosystem II stability/assembly factor-like uncharacterized protein
MKSKKPTVDRNGCAATVSKGRGDPRLGAMIRGLGVWLLAVGAAIVPAGAQEAARSARPEAGEPAKPVSAEAAPSVPESWIPAFQWRNIGPANTGGRITAITVSEKDSSMWWVATAGGGLLKTTNNGVTFENQFDHEATVSIGDVAVAPSDPSILWVGTGECNPRNSVSWGDGVYKSTDGGKTWKNMGLKQGFQVGRIVVHPTDPNIVYVGVLGRLWGPSEERGLYKTTDGGEKWERVLFVDDKTGVIEVQMKPGEPDTLLAGTYERRRDGFDTNEPALRNGPGSGLWRTTDGGKNWTRLYKGLPEGNLGRIGVSFYGKNPNVVYLVVESDRTGTEPENAPYIGLRGTDADVGAKVTDVVKGGPAEAAGLRADDIVISVNGVTVHSYDEFMGEIRKRVAGDAVKMELSRERKSVSADVTLTKRPPPATRQRARDGTGRRTDDTAGAGPFSSGLGGQRGNLTEQQGPDGFQYGGVFKSTDSGETWARINSINPRPMYFSQVRADPSDDTYLWVLGVSLARSKDGGKTFTDDGGRGTHADDHALWIDPHDGRHMILGNDGGLYVSYDRGENWDHLNHVAIGQFYHVAVDPRPNYMVYGGLQDNGSWGGPSRSRSGRGPINEDWVSIGGGDGFVCRVDPTDPDQVYFESQGGAMGRFNLRTGERGSIRPAQERGARYRWNWKTPFILSSHNSRIFYAAANFVFRSVDQGRTMKRLSDEFTRTRRGSGTAIAESPLDSDVLYVGSDDGALLVTRNGAMTWTKLADFPLSEEEKNSQARIEESESGGGAGGGGATANPAAAEAAPLETPAAEAPPTGEGEQPAPAPQGGRGPGGGPAGGGAERMIDRLKQMDANHDGKISKDEVPEQMQRLFDRGDTNGDGVIDEEELKSLPQRMGGGRGAGGGGGGGRGPGGRGDQGPAEPPSGPRMGQIVSAPAPTSPPEQEKAQPLSPAAADDALTGEWSAKATGEDAPPGGAGFTLSLTLAESGKVTGSYDSARGGGSLTDAKFDRQSGAFTATVESERAPIEIKSRLADGKLKGQVDIGDGRFQFEFEAERTSKTPAQPARTDDTGAGSIAGRSLLELLPGPRWVSSIDASRFRAGRVYVTFDGHRSNDDEPYIFVSEDYGRTWRSIRANLPAAAGSTKVIREDLQKENLLFLGTEFGAYVSVDRGRSWTRFNNNLPTVAVFEFALHPTSGEIVAATHGRSLWILDVTPLRQMSDKTAAQEVALFAPRSAVYWRPDPRRGGGNRRFVGENDEPGAAIVYSLNKRVRSVTLQITDPAGEVIRELDAKTEPGLHRVAWDLRRTPEERGGGRGPGGGFGGGAGGGGGGRAGGPGGGGRAGGGGPGAAAGGGGGGGGGGGFGGFGGGRGGRLVPSGTYRVALKVDGELYTKPLVVQTDPQYPDYQPWERGGGFGGGEEMEPGADEEEDEDQGPSGDRDG